MLNSLVSQPCFSSFSTQNGLRPKQEMKGPSGVDDILSGLNSNDNYSDSSRGSADIRNIEVSSNLKKKKKNKKNGGITLDL